MCSAPRPAPPLMSGSPILPRAPASAVRLPSISGVRPFVRRLAISQARWSRSATSRSPSVAYPIPVLSEAVCPERFHRCLLRQCSVSHENASLARFAGPTRPGASAVARATPRPHVRIGSLTTGVPIFARSAATACIAWRATSRLRPPRWWRSERGDSNPRPPVSFQALYRLSRPPGRLVCAGWRATR